MGYVIYKICCDDCDDFYIGSTRNFRVRKNQHKSDCNNPNNPSYNQKNYKFIRANGGWQNWRVVVIEECGEDIKTKRQAEMREEELRVELKAKLNSNRACITEEERGHVEKERQERTKEVIKCICGCDVFRHSLPRHRSKKHLEAMENGKQENNTKEVVKCICGCDVFKSSLYYHLRSKKHLKAVEAMGTE